MSVLYEEMEHIWLLIYIAVIYSAVLYIVISPCPLWGFVFGEWQETHTDTGTMLPSDSNQHKKVILEEKVLFSLAPVILVGLSNQYNRNVILHPRANMENLLLRSGL